MSWSVVIAALVLGAPAVDTSTAGSSVARTRTATDTRGAGVAGVAGVVAPPQAPHEASPVASDLELGLGTASPSALGTGLLMGPRVAADLRSGPWRLGLRVHLGLAAENDLTWAVHHTELRAAARAGVAQPWGRGELGLGVSAGVLALFEQRSRHQADRLGQADIDAQRSATAIGPQLALDASVRLAVLDAWSVHLSGGPTLALLTLGESSDWIVGWAAALGLGYAL